MKTIDVLVVEDDEDARLTLRMVLEQNGCTVRVVDDAEGAVVELRRQLPEVLVTDGRLPHLPGGRLAVHARELASGRAMAVLGISGHTDQNELERISDVFLQKPFDVTVLIDAVHALATSVRERRAARTGGER